MVNSHFYITSILGFSVLRCCLSCTAEHAQGITPRRAHWHCTDCSRLLRHRRQYRDHRNAHARGTQKLMCDPEYMQPSWYMDELMEGMLLPPSLGGPEEHKEDEQDDDANHGWDLDEGVVEFEEEEMKQENKPQQVNLTILLITSN